MKIVDRGRTTTLKENDPIARRIRALLFANADDPIVTLWKECSPDQRAVLAAIAVAREISQVELERTLGGIPSTDLRGRHIAIAKAAKRVGIDYPIVSRGGRREYRRFTLDPDAARHVLRLIARAATTTQP